MQQEKTQITPTVWQRYAIMFQVVTIGFIILLLLIPKGMINGIIQERSSRQFEAQREVSQKWGAPQGLIGPYLIIPYKHYLETILKTTTTIKYAYFLPETLKINGELLPEERKRGIFKVPVYTYKGLISGQFQKPDFSEWGISEEDIIYSQAKIVMGISDLSGINEEVAVNWNNEPIKLQPGVPTNKLTQSGIHSYVSIIDGINKFSIPLSLNGSSHISFAPFGAKTEANLSSSWPSPKFDGRFIPDDRTITNDGFTAFWKILSLNRNYPQKWKEKSDYHPERELFSVSLFQSVDHYKLNTRTSKYAIIIILLVFTTFFFFEVLKKQMVHPLQYIFIGLAIIIFYLLLLSFSEHFGFDKAYTIASIAVITLILIYSSAILKSKNMIMILGLALGAVFGFIFIILQMEDFALLAGSLGLFLVLATIMFVSRKVNWYKINE